MAQDARQTLALNRQEAISLAQRVGVARTRKLLEAADADLRKRMLSAMLGPGRRSFTYEQMKSALMQVRHVLAGLRTDLKGVLTVGADEAADNAVGGIVDYLGRAQREFGVGHQPLALKEAAMLDAARGGAQASILRRIASSGEPVEGADEEPHPAKLGVLDRYSVETIGVFEDEMQVGLLARKPLDEVRDTLIEKSPFLRAKPASWAERIVRTEMMGAYNRAGWEATREADEQLGDMVKILSATFDDRTGADSYAVHGQIRRPDEAFQSWFGLYQHPPNRPNDREIVVPHRVSWPLPGYLMQKSDGEIAARWAFEKRKGPIPPRPKMTTVPLKSFGVEPPPRIKRAPEEAPTTPQDAEQAPVESTQASALEEAATQAPSTTARARRAKARAEGRAAAHERLAAMPTLAEDDPSMEGYSFAVGSKGFVKTPFHMGVAAEAAALTGGMTSPLAQALASLETSQAFPKVYKSVKLEKLHALRPGILKESIAADIDRPKGSAAIIPLVVKHNGKLWIHAGDSQLAAAKLAGNASAKVNVFDLDAVRRDQAKKAAAAAEALAAASIPKSVARRPVERSKGIDADAAWAKTKNIYVSSDALAAAHKLFGGKPPALTEYAKIYGTPKGYRTELHSMTSGYGGGVRVEIRVTNEKDGTSTTGTRTFRKDPDGLAVHHDYLRLPDHWQGGGFGEEMTRNALLSYGDLGIKRVDTDPHWVGRYTWASFGFSWNEATGRRTVPKFRAFLKAIGFSDGAAEKTSHIAMKSYELADVVHPTEMEPHPKTGKMAPRKIGKEFLLRGGEGGKDSPVGRGDIQDHWSGGIELDPANPSYQHAFKRLKLSESQK